MALIKPQSGENQDEFVSRCMSDNLMQSEFTEQKQNQQLKVITKLKIKERRLLQMEKNSEQMSDST